MLLNEEFDWERSGLGNPQVVDDEPEAISVAEVRDDPNLEGVL